MLSFLKKGKDKDNDKDEDKDNDRNKDKVYTLEELAYFESKTWSDSRSQPIPKNEHKPKSESEIDYLRKIILKDIEEILKTNNLPLKKGLSI